MAWKGKAKSIALNFVLHCIEGTLRTKGGAAFSKLKRLLRKDGVLFGATILGACAPHTGFGRALMRRFNMPFKPSMSFSGIFANNLETTSTPRRTCLHCVHTLPSSKFGSWAARRFLRQPTTRCGSLSSFGDWGETYFWGQFRFWFLARSCENAVARPGAPFTLPPPLQCLPLTDSGIMHNAERGLSIRGDQERGYPSHSQYRLCNNNKTSATIKSSKLPVASTSTLFANTNTSNTHVLTADRRLLLALRSSARLW